MIKSRRIAILSGSMLIHDVGGNGVNMVRLGCHSRMPHTVGGDWLWRGKSAAEAMKILRPVLDSIWCNISCQEGRVAEDRPQK